MNPLFKTKETSGAGNVKKNSSSGKSVLFEFSGAVAPRNDMLPIGNSQIINPYGLRPNGTGNRAFPPRPWKGYPPFRQSKVFFLRLWLGGYSIGFAKRKKNP